MADKNFKVKNGITIQGEVDTIITADNSGGILIGGEALSGGGGSAAEPTTLGSVYGNTAVEDGVNLTGGQTSLGNAAAATGNYSIALGYIAATDRDWGVAIGYGSQANYAGTGNVAVGPFANANEDNTVAIGNNAYVDGSGSTLLGAYTTSNSTGSTVLGYNAFATGNNQFVLGASNITSLRCQVTSITSLSDARDKENIEPLALGVDFINSLNPVKFNWNMRPPENPRVDKDGNPIILETSNSPDIGFIAQDLVAAEDATGLTDYLKLTLRDNPDRLEATQGRLIPILVKAIQELSAEIETLKGAK